MRSRSWHDAASVRVADSVCHAVDKFYETKEIALENQADDLLHSWLDRAEPVKLSEEETAQFDGLLSHVVRTSVARHAHSESLSSAGAASQICAPKLHGSSKNHQEAQQKFPSR